MKTIAWDVDDVLNDLMRSWFQEKWLKEYPDCSVRYYDITENPPHQVLKIDIDTYLRSLDEFRLSDLYGKMHPVKEVMDWFNRNGNDFRHVALTSVPLVAAPYSAQWVLKHFGKWIRTFHFVPSRRKGEDLPGYDENKGTFLKWIEKIDILVDDNIVNIRDAEMAGVKGILIPRPWNDNKNAITTALAALTNI